MKSKIIIIKKIEIYCKKLKNIINNEKKLYFI